MMGPLFLYGHGSGGGGGHGVKGNPQTGMSQGTYDGKVKENAGNLPSSAPKEGADYNIGGKIPSSVIKHPVKSAEGNIYIHRKPVNGKPNSVFRSLDANGKLYSERYFDENGLPYLEIEYTDHGMPGTHTNPHYHTITIDKYGNIKRGPQRNVEK